MDDDALPMQLVPNKVEPSASASGLERTFTALNNINSPVALVEMTPVPPIEGFKKMIGYILIYF